MPEDESSIVKKLVLKYPYEFTIINGEVSSPRNYYYDVPDKLATMKNENVV